MEKQTKRFRKHSWEKFRYAYKSYPTIKKVLRELLQSLTQFKKRNERTSKNSQMNEHHIGRSIKRDFYLDVYTILNRI